MAKKKRKQRRSEGRKQVDNAEDPVQLNSFNQETRSQSRVPDLDSVSAAQLRLYEAQYEKAAIEARDAKRSWWAKLDSWKAFAAIFVAALGVFVAFRQFAYVQIVNERAQLAKEKADRERERIDADNNRLKEIQRTLSDTNTKLAKEYSEKRAAFESLGIDVDAELAELRLSGDILNAIFIPSERAFILEVNNHWGPGMGHGLHESQVTVEISPLKASSYDVRLRVGHDYTSDPVSRRADSRTSIWYEPYEDHNVEVRLVGNQVWGTASSADAFEARGLYYSYD